MTNFERVLESLKESSPKIDEGKLADGFDKLADKYATFVDAVNRQTDKLRKMRDDATNTLGMKIANALKTKFAVGDKVLLYPNSPLFKDIKLTAVVIDKSRIKVNDKGVPTNTASDAYLPPDWEHEIPISLDGDNAFMIVHRSLLKKQ